MLKIILSKTISFFSLICFSFFSDAQPRLSVNFSPRSTLSDSKREALCPRFNSSTPFIDPPSISSLNNILSLTMNYEWRFDASVPTVESLSANIFCYETYYTSSNDNVSLASPLLRVNPGDEVRLLVNNNLPSEYAQQLPIRSGLSLENFCGSTFITNATINIHFHGMEIPPQCHKDNVILTLINPGTPFLYNFIVPSNAHPGLYGYHNHVHGTAEGSLLGGAGGAILVNGIENVYPQVAGLPERVIILRDKLIPNEAFVSVCNGQLNNCPLWDVSVNQISVGYPDYVPVPYQIRPSNSTHTYREFWRVIHAGADTIMNISLIYDGVYQDLQIVALDNTVVYSDADQKQGGLLVVKYIILSSFNRAEFIVTSPQASVSKAIFNNNLYYAGPIFFPLLERPLLRLIPNTEAVFPSVIIPNPTKLVNLTNDLPNINNYRIDVNRTIIFSEIIPAGNQPPTFFVTVAGVTPKAFITGQEASINTIVGSKERWTIINNSTEDHVFHIHQLKFLLESVNGNVIPVEKRLFYDTFVVEYTPSINTDPFQVNTTSAPSSITVLIDFTAVAAGTFVYHCHVVAHEDLGMMASIFVASKPITNNSIKQISISCYVIVCSFLLQFMLINQIYTF